MHLGQILDFLDVEIIASIKFSVDCSLRCDLSVRGCSMVV